LNGKRKRANEKKSSIASDIAGTLVRKGGRELAMPCPARVGQVVKKGEAIKI